jgi:hypothetical protein
MKSAIVFGLIVFGLLLLLGSGVWATIFPGTSQWSDEKDQRLSEVGARMHVLRFTVGNGETRPNMHGGPDLIKAKAELESLKEEYKTLSDEFHGIQSRPHTVSKVMKWSGISLAVVGLIGWYAVNQSK